MPDAIEWPVAPRHCFWGVRSITSVGSGKTAINAWVGALGAVKIMEARPAATLPLLIGELAETFGETTAFIDDAGELSHRAFAGRARQYARWVKARGFRKGETICLLMQNCSDYVAVWLGLSQAGCVVALLNANLQGDALLHCIRIAAPVCVIVAPPFYDTLAAVLSRLAPAPDCRCTVPAPGMPGDFLDVSGFSVDALEAFELEPVGPRDVALLIYTSGTTGLPKAAKVSHGRLVEWSYWFAGMMDARPNDRLYNCLPMYHSTGGVVAIGAMLVRGGSVFIRPRFSVSRLWDEIVDGGCTIFFYIGELCRYLLQAPPHARERAHRLRLCCGNGLSGAVWEPFAARFSIPRILEFYAATEGSVSLYNCEGRPGAIGRVPPFIAHRAPVALVKCDLDGNALLRGDDGGCIMCGPDEPGEALGKITGAGEPARQFDGYTDANASAAKIACDVLTPGDRWFRTGDLMRRDAAGYYYFIDRLGDNFRWKGENVSSTEVAGVVGTCPGVVAAVVFGAAVPGHEGKAGMAGITVEPAFDMAVLAAHVTARLPDYACPLYVRICAALAVTGTFKLQKEQLRREGYDNVAPPDTIWYYDRAQARFMPYFPHPPS